MYLGANLERRSLIQRDEHRSFLNLAPLKEPLAYAFVPYDEVL